MLRTLFATFLVSVTLPMATAQGLADGTAPGVAATAPQAPTQASVDTLPLGGIAAIVNDQPISYSDVIERAQLLLLGLGSQPTPEQVQQITGRALEQLIDEKLQLEEAAQYEVTIESAEIASEIEGMARQSGLDRDGLLNQLLAAGINPVSLEEQMRAEIAWRRVMRGLYGSRIRISQNQIDEELEQIKRAASQTTYNLSEIFLFAQDIAQIEQARQAADSIVAQLEQGAPFELAAQRFSSAPTAATGGNMGWVSLDDLEPEVAEAVSALPGPGLTEPIIVPDGVYILALFGVREPQESDTVVSLVRVASETGDDEALAAATATLDGCDAAEALASENAEFSAVRLNDIALSGLADDAANRIAAIDVNASTDVFEMASKPTVMVICSRQDGGSGIPDRSQIENRLYGQQLSRIAQRALRDLKREATIIRREL
ncbi:MAG: peptidylprolyl isomerase [Pseudomonadota bacterium]